MNRFTVFCSLCAVMAVMAACTPATHRLSDGRWRGEFKTGNNRIPFVFEVSDAATSSPKLVLLNGAERMQVDSVGYDGDSLVISIRAYDVQLRAFVDGASMKGALLKTLGGKRVPFTARQGDAPRFPVGDQPTVSINGRWSITVAGDEGDIRVGNFEQLNDGTVTGSILTTTGDYRYLEGVVQGKRFSLSAFGGMTPYLLQGECSDNDHFTARFVTPNGTTPMNGVRNANAELPDPFALTSIKNDEQKVTFSFPNSEGKIIASSDGRYAGKPLIISIMGSWCPNCADEADFLAPWYEANRSRVEVVAFAFERRDDVAFARTHLAAFKKRHHTGYEILFAGKADKNNVNRALPMLHGFISYPTLLFVDKNGFIRKIHTGFSGPATGEFYQNFIRDFEAAAKEIEN